MSAPLRSSLRPRCTSCARRFTDAGLRAWSPFQQQVRGKKKASNVPQTIAVRLLKDVKGYGRKGSLVPVSAGLMRNNWVPSRTADYLTMEEKREVKVKDVPIERDHTFGMEEVQAEEEKGPEVLEIAKPKPIEVQRISPQRSMELIDIFVPARIDIRKTANEKLAQQQKPKQQQPPRPRGMSAADVLAAASVAPAQPVDERIPIHGSVSTADIANFVKEQLAVNEEGSRVVVAEGDVHWTHSASAEDGRVRYLGEYEVEIKLKGVEQGVRRKVRVLKTDQSSEVVPEVES